jgi:branched-chain amino acid transport system ATP-binding protein
MLTGIYTPTSGTIHYRDILLNNRQPHEIAKMGICRTFQNIRLFDKMTVIENVMVASHTRTAERFINILTRSKKMRKTEAAVESNAMTLLELVGLADYRYEYAPSLPYGLQRKLEIARAMAAEPEIILLDEPAAGMNDRETSEMAKFILEIRDMGFTVVLIEHDMRLVMGICDRVYVLNFGSLIAEGCCEDVKTNPAVIEAYLGKEVQLNASTRS